MENLIESNERTLVMFDEVCSGLAACLAMVHSDIKQMTEHRNELAQIEHHQVQARLKSPHELANESLVSDKMTLGDQQANVGSAKKQQHQKDTSIDKMANNLKLLDKRLADSFSQALSLNGTQRRNSWALKQHNKPSLFQVLLGKSKSSSNNNNNNNKSKDLETKKLDNKTIIDDINRQTRMAMQYSKQLEAHLFKVEDLRSKYEMHLKMGLVVKSVARAYMSPLTHSKSHAPPPSPQCSLDKRGHHCSSLVINDSSSVSTISLSGTKALSTTSLRKNKKDQQSANRTTIKEFIENIAKIEEEFESYMGSFLVAIEDIQGFARVCQGDVFEISIKYGDLQKLKSKISVLKENRQKCDNRQAVFKARIADVLAIKAFECKGLGKRVLLGHKLCETRDLFTARTQLMTISLNQTGSIKLNLIVTWNPLHMTPTSAILNTDIAHVSYPRLSSTMMMSNSNLSVPSIYSSIASVNQPETITTINISRTGKKMGSSQQQKHLHDPYQMVDPTYGYYVPPPDYLTNEVKYGET